MKKTIRKVGSSIGLIFSQEERKNHKLKEGDIIDISKYKMLKCKK